MGPLHHHHHHHHGHLQDHGHDDSAAGIRAVKISLAVLGLTALIQGVIVVASGSVALFADTVHNLSDALTAVPLWIAFALGARAASRHYTYGLGRAEDLVGMAIFLASPEADYIVAQTYNVDGGNWMS